MASQSGQNSFQRGVLSLVILSLLNKEDMYGYQLLQETQKVSENRIITQEGSLYPVLYKLLEQGYISDKKVQVGKRMTRIYYHLEPTGISQLNELLHEFQELTLGIQLITQECGL